jgi:hypothetical protein
MAGQSQHKVHTAKAAGTQQQTTAGVVLVLLVPSC